MLGYAIGVAYRMNQGLNVGCRFITVDAYPKSVPWYLRNGFAFNRSAEDQKKNRSMRYDRLRTP